MTLAEQAARKRKTLEATGKLKHDSRFDDRVKKENKNLLLAVAVLTAIVYGFSVDAYYRIKYSGAQSGKIHAKSEMTKAEISKLNLAGK